MIVLARLVGCAAPPPLVVVPPSDLPSAVRLAVLVGYELPGVADPIGVEQGLQRARDALAGADPPFDVVVLQGPDANTTRLADVLEERTRGAPNAGDHVLVWVMAHGDGAVDGTRSSYVLLAGNGSAPARVSVGYLLDSLDALPARNTALVLDACYPKSAAPGTGGARSWTPLFTATRMDRVAKAANGDGGLYSTCLATAITSGAVDLLTAHGSATRCVRDAVPGQEPQLYPGGQVGRFSLRSGPSPQLLAVDGLTRVLPPGVTLLVDPPVVESGDGLGTFPCPGRCVPIEVSVSLVRDGTVLAGPERRVVRPGTPLFIGRPPDPSIPPDRSWLSVTTPNGDVAPRFDEVADGSGLVALTDGRLSGVAAVALLGGRPGLFVTRSDGPPRYLENVAAPGAVPRYIDRSADLRLATLPADGAGWPPRVYDLDHNGQPEVCYIADRLVCVDRLGPVPLERRLPTAALREPPLHVRLDDRDGLDLVAHVGDRWVTWRWDGTRYGQEALVQSGPPTSNAPVVIDLDTTSWPDLLFTRGEGPRLYENRLERADHWDPAPILLADGLFGRRFLRSRVLPNGSVNLIFPAEQGDPSGGVDIAGPGGRGRLFDDPVPGPRSPGDGEVYDVVSGDLDRDGLRDLILVHRGFNQPGHRVFLQRPGVGNGWVRLDIPGMDLSTDDQMVLVEDLNDDGWLDLLALNQQTPRRAGPTGRSRLFLHQGLGGGRHTVRVDVDPREGAFAGSELTVQTNGVTIVEEIDGSRAVGAAEVAIGAAAAPSAAQWRWPNGSVTTFDVAELQPFGEGYRVTAHRPSGRRRVLLVGPYRVEIDDPDSKPVRLQRFEGQTVFPWAVRVGDQISVGVDGPEGGRLWWLNERGDAVGRAVPSPGCGWVSALAGLDQLIAGCEPSDGPKLGSIAAGGQTWTLEPLETLGITHGLPRTAAVAEGQVFAALASPSASVVGLDPRTLRPTGVALDPVDNRAGEREHVVATSDGRLLVLDRLGARVEVWDVAGAVPQRVAVIPLGPPVRTAWPVWDPERGWWWVPVVGGLDAVDPSYVVGPVWSRRWSGASEGEADLCAVLPLRGSELALLTSRDGGMFLNVIDVGTGSRVRAQITFPDSFVARHLIALAPR